MTHTLTSRQVAAMIDYALLQPDMTHGDIARGIETALEYEAGTVFVRPTDVSVARPLLSGCGTKLASVVGFPLGFQPACAKAAEARYLLDLGCDELDMVVNIGLLKSGCLDAVREDMAAVADATHNAGRIAKVILENGYLTDEEKIAACRAAEQAGMDFVKTATGMGAGGATLADIRLMRASCSPRVQVKAAGGIRTLDQLLSAVAAGATRIGSSSLKAIVSEARIRERQGPLAVAEVCPLGDGY